jgi:hypothetical protein
LSRPEVNSQTRGKQQSNVSRDQEYALSGGFRWGSIQVLMIQKKKPPQWTNQRSVLRCPLVASAEITDLHSGTRLSVRISELGVGGCYVDALTPFPEGTLVKLRIIRDQGAFESNGKVVYTHANFGMGVAFTNVTSDQRSILEGWIAEIVSKRA